MSLINSTAIPSGAGYEIGQSLRFEDGSSAYLSRTPSSAGNRKTWTMSLWFKRGNLTNDQTIFQAGTTGGNRANIYLANNTIQFLDTTSTDVLFTSSQLLRDVSSWYHLVVQFDTTQGTASDRLKMYLNGTRITAFADSNTIAQNTDGLVNSTIAHAFGTPAYNSGIAQFDGYMAEVHFIDGTALTPTSFGETGTYEEWKPIGVSGLTYGTNGFYLNFATAADMGDDKSGNTNDWAENNIAATDQMLDSPTNNFCTLNPLARHTNGGVTWSEGNLKAASGNYFTYGTMAVSSGKWYFEVHIQTAQGGGVGVTRTDVDHQATGALYDPGWFTNGWGYYKNGQTYRNQTYTNYGDSFTTGDIISVAVDLDNSKIWFAKNNTWQASGNPVSGANAAFSNVTYEVFPKMGSHSDSYVVANFGQDSSFAGNKTAQGNTDGNSKGDFYYAPPTGFLALCTKNLPDVAVIPQENSSTVIYSGNGGNQSITGVGFQPDFVWIKNRSAGNYHLLVDSIRGTNKYLASNATMAEVTEAHILSLSSDGFTVDDIDTGTANESGDNYVAWNWKANGSGSSNTNGSINSTVSANVDAGFSIVSYTGTATNATVGHGLSSAPEMVIIKNRSDGSYWIVGTDGLTSWSRYIPLNLTNAETNEPTQFNSTAPTSSVFSIGTNADVNGNTHNIIAYAFHSVDGYSKVGTYTGNGNADGAFIYTGFRPAFVICKMVTDAGEGWIMRDNARNPFNVVANHLNANQSYADSTASSVYADFLSNGFKQRANDSINNGSGKTYIYIAFAETPFKYSNAR